jgi:hypothetical protein
MSTTTQGVAPPAFDPNRHCLIVSHGAGRDSDALVGQSTPVKDVIRTMVRLLREGETVAVEEIPAGTLVRVRNFRHATGARPYHPLS